MKVHPPRIDRNFQKNCCQLFKCCLLFGSINHFEFWFVFEEPEAMPGLGLRYFKIRHRLISLLSKWLAVVRWEDGPGKNSRHYLLLWRFYRFQG